VSAGWVAAQVRSQGLVHRCLGPAETRRLAESGSLHDALEMLGSTAYAIDLHPELDVENSERVLWASVLWDLRVLAGWAPPFGATRFRVLAGAFELANINAQLARCEGRPAAPPYVLGSLAAIRDLSSAGTVDDLRRVLKASPWGDPGTSEPDEFRLALQFSLVRQVAEGVPEAANWATSFAVLLLARCITAGVLFAPGSPAEVNARAVMGERVTRARTLEELASAVPHRHSWVLEGAVSSEDLWTSETRWWARMWSEGLSLVQRGRPQPGAVVGAVGALASDAWRIRASLEVAARGGSGIEELDGVA